MFEDNTQPKGLEKIQIEEVWRGLDGSNDRRNTLDV